MEKKASGTLIRKTYYHLKLRQWENLETTRKASFSSKNAFCCFFHVFPVENSFRDFFFKREVVVTAKGGSYECPFYEYFILNNILNLRTGWKARAS